MPLAMIFVDRNNLRLTDKIITDLGKHLRELIPAALSCTDEGGALVPEDVEVMVMERNPCDVGGEKYDFRVIIYANEYPNRSRHLKMQTDWISARINKLMPSFRGYVWVFLERAHFSPFGT